MPFAAITHSVLSTTRNSTTGTSLVTGSNTPVSGEIMIATFNTLSPTGGNSHSALTGMSVTWTQITTVDCNGTGFGVMSIWWASAVGATTGALTLTLTVTANESGAIVESFKADQTLPWSNLVLQTENSNPTQSVTLAAFERTENGTFMANAGQTGSGGGGISITVGTGFTIGAQELNIAGSPGMSEIATQWRADNDTSVDATWSTGLNFASAGFEIRAQNATAYTLDVTPTSYAITTAPVSFSYTTPTPATAYQADAFQNNAFQIVSSGSPFTLDVTPATYNITASNVSLAVDRQLATTPVAYLITASDVGLAVGRQLAVAPASYLITTSNATVVVDRQLAVAPASYLITASNATVVVDRNVSVTPASYAITASDVAVTVNRQLAITPEVYAITTVPVELIYTPVAGSVVVDVTPALYLITASDVDLTYTPSSQGGGNSNINSIRRDDEQVMRLVIEAFTKLAA